MTDKEKTNWVNKQIEDTNYKWYVLSVVSWQEAVVVKNLHETVKKSGLEWQVEEIFFPEITTVKMMKNWEKKVTVKKLHPGYVYIKSMMNDKIWYILRNTPGVRLIIWSDIYPTPVSDKEMENIIKTVKESSTRAEMDVPYMIWDKVKLKSEELGGIEWEIIKINKDSWQLQVKTSLMWRETIVNVTYNKVEKII